MSTRFLTRAATLVAALSIASALIVTMAELGHPHPDGYWAAAMDWGGVTADPDSAAPGLITAQARPQP